MKNILETTFSKIKYYHEPGNDKPRVLLIHGYNSSMGFAVDLIHHKKREEQKDFYITAIDLPGFGGSTTTKKISLTFLGNELWDFITRLKLINIHVVSHSMGADTALRINAHPEVKKTLLISPFNYKGLKHNKPKELLEKLSPSDENQAKSSLINLVFDHMKRGYNSNIDRKATGFLNYVNKTNFQFKNILFDSILSPSYLKNELTTLYLNAKNISMISGSKDVFVRKESLQEISKELNIPLKLIDDIGHAFIFETPDVALEEITKLTKE